MFGVSFWVFFAGYAGLMLLRWDVSGQNGIRLCSVTFCIRIDLFTRMGAVILVNFVLVYWHLKE